MKIVCRPGKSRRSDDKPERRAYGAYPNEKTKGVGEVALKRYMRRILLVEDDNDIVSGLTEFLEKEGYSVVNAPGQSEALRLMREVQIDLLLLDIALSNGNGFAVCRAAKSEYGLPVIFLTASGDEYSTVAGFDLGADDYIAKPFRPRELVSRINNVLRLTGGGARIYRKIL